MPNPPKVSTQIERLHRFHQSLQEIGQILQQHGKKRGRAKEGRKEGRRSVPKTPEAAICNILRSTGGEKQTTTEVGT